MLGGCWCLETATAFTLSAMSSCPDLPAALLAYKGKCTQRLRPRSGDEGQLTPKALLQRPASPEEIPAGAIPKYHIKISGAQQNSSNMDTEHKLVVTAFSLLWTVLGTLDKLSCQLLQPSAISLACMGSTFICPCQPLPLLLSNATAENTTKNAALPKEQMGCLIPSDHPRAQRSPPNTVSLSHHQQRETFHEIPSLQVLTKAGHV